MMAATDDVEAVNKPDESTNTIVSENESKEIESSPPSISKLLSIAKPEIPMLILSAVLMIASEASQMVVPLIVADAYDTLVNPSFQNEDERMTEINHFMLIAIIVSVTGLIAGFARASIQGVIGERVVARLRCTLYAQILKQEIAFFDEHKSGELNSRLGSDTTLLQTVVSQSLPDFFIQMMKAISALVLMFVLSSKLAGVALGGVLLIFVLSAPLGKLMGRLSKDYQDILGQAATLSTEAIGSMRTVQAFAAEQKEMERYNSKIGNPDEIPLWWPPSGQKTTYRFGFFKAITASGFFTWVFGAGFGFLNVTLWYGFYLVIHGEITLGELTAFNSYIISIGFAMGSMAGAIAKIFEGIGASGRVFYLVDRVPLIPNAQKDLNKEGVQPASPKKPQSMQGNVEFDNVTFSYPSRPDEKVLNSVSISMKANTTTALVGSSGAGKSTIVSLLQRFYDIDEGSISVDGHDITSIDLNWLRQHIGYVQQEPHLFGMTIRENLTYGLSREVSQEELERATRDAHAHEFISKMSDQYETLVGERGVKLSGGQKQRVAIARALLTNCRILLLDEATSALDAESEHLVQQAIDKAVVGRTVIVVAHRLSTIRQADQIVVMDDHKVVDSGAHSYLMENCEKYQDLIKRQNVMMRDVSANGLNELLPEDLGSTN